MILGYIRVSTFEQNPGRQQEALAAAGCEKIFLDKASGGNAARPQLLEMLDYIRENDELIITSLDRLGRSIKDLNFILEKLQQKKSTLKILNLGIDTKTPAGKMIFDIMGAFAEFELSIIRERIREGVALAKEKGLYKGRKPLDKDILNKLNDSIEKGITISRACKDQKVSRSWYYKYKDKK